MIFHYVVASNVFGVIYPCSYDIRDGGTLEPEKLEEAR